MNPEAMASMNPYGQEVEVTLQEKLAEIDNAIEGFKKQIEVGEAIKRLEANPDYELVVSSGYFQEEAERITGLIVGDDPLRRESMENIVEAALAIRNFKQYLKYKKMDAVQAPGQIEENMQFRRHVTANYAADGSLIDDAEVVE